MQILLHNKEEHLDDLQYMPEIRQEWHFQKIQRQKLLNEICPPYESELHQIRNLMQLELPQTCKANRRKGRLWANKYPKIPQSLNLRLQ